jgi:hypothetical protein
MKLKLTIGMTAVVCATLILNGCGSDNNGTVVDDNTSVGVTPAPAPRFSTEAKGSDTVERDSQAKLEWIGSVGTTGGAACTPNSAAGSEMVEIAEAKAFCEALVFAGSSDWRTGTAMENQEHIRGMQAQGLTPFYLVSACPRLIGVDTNNSASAVNTHNITGAVGNLTPWATLLQQPSNNFGVKCVRDY